MITKKHLLILLLAIFPLVNITQSALCELGQRISHMICKNGNITGTLPIVPISLEIESVTLFSVTGDVHSNALQNFPSVKYLTISASTINSFSLQSNITVLSVDNSVFPNVTSEVLEGCKQLQIVSFLFNNGLKFHENAFKHLKNLSALDIVDQTLPRIKRSFFEGLGKVQRLMLISDHIQEIDDDAFFDVPSLKVLLLDDNPIESFNANLSGLTNLSQLSLLHTNLKSLNFDSLGSLNKLTSIMLPRQLVRRANVTQLLTKVPSLEVVGVSYEEQECPDVISFVGKLGKTRVRSENVFLYKNFSKPSDC